MEAIELPEKEDMQLYATDMQLYATDMQLYNLQQTVLKVTFATLDTTNALVANKSEFDHSQLVAHSVDSIANC